MSSQHLALVSIILSQELTAVQVAGDGGIGDEEVVEVGVLLEWRNISSSMLPWPDGDVATNAAATWEGDILIIIMRGLVHLYKCHLLNQIYNINNT